MSNETGMFKLYDIRAKQQTLTEEMKSAAKILEFEHAAYLRDRINKLREGL